MFLLPTEERGQSLKRLIEDYGPLQRLMKQMEKWPSIRETTVETVMQLVNVQRLEAVELLKKLEKGRLGSFVTGRRGAKTRLIWRYNPKKLYELAKAEKRDAVVATLVEPAMHEISKQPELTEHRFMLRKDFELTLQLPRDLAMKDAERAAAWLRTLPFE